MPITEKPRAARLLSMAFSLALVFGVGTALAQDYAEAPQLAARVDADELPSVAERLPDDPVVVQPFESIGEYGGTWRLNMASASDVNTLVRTIGYENFTRWRTWSPDIEQEDVVPDVEMNVASNVDISDDGRVYTFHLRPGLRWSDGEPYTADDVMFWYEAVYLNEELMPTKPAWSVRGGEPVVVEKIDDHTVTFSFAEPHGLLLQWMATPANDREPNVPTAYPRHYLDQFHPDYADDVEVIVEREGQQNWVTLFHAKADAWSNPEVPRLNPWIVTQGIGQGAGSRVVAERNPYYWKVDPEGNQLPYIDRVTVEIVPDAEVRLLKAANGDYDMVDSYIGFVTTPENRAVFFENQEAGNYAFYEVLPNRANLFIFSLNMTHKNPALREVFSNRTFRQALSTAINREEIIELVFLGQGRPYQVVERPESPLFDEEMATQYTEFSIEEANHMLDEAGFTERDANGIRLGPDGNPIRFTVDIATIRQPWIDGAELMAGYWRQIGIDLSINTTDTTNLNQRVENNNHDAAIWSASAGADTLFDPKYYFPYAWNAFYAPPWGQWYSGAAGAEEPPEAARRQMELYDEIQATTDIPTRVELMQELMRISAEQFYTIGIMQPTTDYGIINVAMRNVPPVLLASTEYTHPGSANPEQFYFASE